MWYYRGGCNISVVFKKHFIYCVILTEACMSFVTLECLALMVLSSILYLHFPKDADVAVYQQ